MSHSKERTEKICLNCNAALHGKYCHVCGQENIEPHETVWGLVSHFFYDITHFDGKFFQTTGYLISRPGFLPQEYLAGRRARYLHPIRMYVFSSALFFLVFFSFYSSKSIHLNESEKTSHQKAETLAQVDSLRRRNLATAHNATDSFWINKSYDAAEEGIRSGALSKVSFLNPGISLGDSLDKDYKTVEAYDSAQARLPRSERDGWFSRLVKHRNLEVRNKYHDHSDELMADISEKFLHTFPYLLFVSLPLYAFYLKLLYWRHKAFYYVNHGIFLIYLYIFTFIFLLVYVGVTRLKSGMHWQWLWILETLLLVGGVYYAYKAMRRFYGQTRGQTLLKFFLLNVLAGCSLIILFVLFFVLAVFRL